MKKILIYRENFTPSKDSVVCADRFSEDVILRDGLHLENYGLEVKRRVRLQKGAIPTIFSGQPSYLTSKTPIKIYHFTRAQCEHFMWIIIDEYCNIKNVLNLAINNVCMTAFMYKLFSNSLNGFLLI